MTRLLHRESPLVPEFHPGIETLAEYAAGKMRAGFDFVLATHLRGCASCRNIVAQLEAVGGSLLETIAPVALDDQALAATLDRLDDPISSLEPSAPPARSLDQLLAVARRRWIMPGIWIAHIDTPHDRTDRVFLLRVGAGMATAPHTHDGLEMTQVLTGALVDDGVTYRAGDMIEMDQEHLHYPKVIGDQPCVCLLATCRPLKPTTLKGRIAFTLAGV